MDCQEKDQWLELSMDGVVEEGWQYSSLDPMGVEPKTSWSAIKDLTNCVNLAHVLL